MVGGVRGPNWTRVSKILSPRARLLRPGWEGHPRSPEETERVLVKEGGCTYWAPRLGPFRLVEPTPSWRRKVIGRGPWVKDGRR